MVDAGLKLRANRFDGPEKKAVDCKIFEDNEQIEEIVCLGDIHGWAPGFIRHLSANKIANVNIAGLEDVSQGEIEIDRQRVDHLPPAKRGIAMVFQSYALYPHMNVYQNMSFGLRLAKTDKKITDQKVRDAAEILQITELLERKPKELSGG